MWIACLMTHVDKLSFPFCDMFCLDIIKKSLISSTFRSSFETSNLFSVFLKFKNRLEIWNYLRSKRYERQISVSTLSPHPKWSFQYSVNQLWCLQHPNKIHGEKRRETLCEIWFNFDFFTRLICQKSWWNSFVLNTT